MSVVLLEIGPGVRHVLSEYSFQFIQYIVGHENLQQVEPAGNNSLPLRKYSSASIFITLSLPELLALFGRSLTQSKPPNQPKLPVPPKHGSQQYILSLQSEPNIQPSVGVMRRACDNVLSSACCGNSSFDEQFQIAEQEDTAGHQEDIIFTTHPACGQLIAHVQPPPPPPPRQRQQQAQWTSQQRRAQLSWPQLRPLSLLLLLRQMLLMWLLLVLCPLCFAATPPLSVLRSPPLSPRTICRGWLHTCAILSPDPASSHHHRLLCWGDGSDGALGRGGNGDRAPLGINEFPSAGGYVDLGRGVQPLAVACGSRTTCVLVTTTDATELGGTALCFGRVKFLTPTGYFTVGTTSAPSASAVTVVTATTASTAAAAAAVVATAAVSAGRAHVCILNTDMRMACAGPSHYHGYGPGSPPLVLPSDLPSRGYLRLGAAAADMACGEDHTCAVTAALRLRCFGVALDGRLGYGNTTAIGDDEHPSAAGAVAVGAPLLSLGLGTLHTCAVTTALRPRCFGQGDFGKLGLDTADRVNLGDNKLPSVYGAVEAGAAVIAVAGGHYHSCAVTSALQLRCWGYAGRGSLGYGRGGDTLIGRTLAVSRGGRVPLGTDGSSPLLQLPGTGVGRKAVGVSSYYDSTCVLTAQKEVLCWGGTHGRYLGYPGLGVICSTATPADYGAVQLGGGGSGGNVAEDPSVIRILWCDSHFGNASTLRLPAAGQQQQLASCALGFPFTLGVIGTPSSPHGPASLSLRRSPSDAVDTQCALHPTPAVITSAPSTAAVGCSSGSDRGVHSHSGAHYMASLAVRLPLLPRLVYTVERATVPPVTTLALDKSRTPFSTSHGLTNRRRLLFLLGSSRSIGAHYVITTSAAAVAAGEEDSSQQFTTNSTRLWLSLASEGAHNLTVYTVDAVGVEDPSPLTLRWLADFTPPSTAIVSGPTQPVAATATAHFKFGCSDSSYSSQQQQQATCSYRVALRQVLRGGGGGGDNTASSSARASGARDGVVSNGTTFAITPVTVLHAPGVAPAALFVVSASAHVAFRVIGGRGGGAGGGGTIEYRLISGDAADTIVQHHPWHTIASAGDSSGSSDFTLRNLPDGAYVLQLRSGGGGSYYREVVAFSVDTTAPRTHVQNVTRASDGGKALWHVEATDLVCSGGDVGGSAVAALWWAAVDNTVADAADDVTSSSPPALHARWRRVNASATVAAMSLSAPLWATVLRVKVEDAAGNVDSFPRTISWGHALSLRSAPPSTTFQTSATFALAVATSSSLPSGDNNAPPPTVRWRLDGAGWQSAARFSESILITSLSPGPHVWEAQPMADDGSPDVVQSTPVHHTWLVLSSASLDGSGMSFTDLSDGAYGLEAVAVDAAGNVDSGNATYRWSVDTTPPSCSAALEHSLGGNSGSGTGGHGSSGGGRVGVSGSEAMASVQLALDHNALVSVDWSNIAVSPPRQHVTTTFPAVTHDGVHVLRVKAADAVGNMAVLPCAVLQWLIDTKPPTVTLLPPRLGGVDDEKSSTVVTNQRMWNATVSAQDRLSPVVNLSYAVYSRDQVARPATTSTTAVAQWKEVPLPSRDQQRGGGHQESDHIDVDVTTAVSVPVSVSSVTGDDHFSLWLRAVDAAGNVAVAPAVFNWTVDTTPPAVTLHAAALPYVIAHHWLPVCVHFTEPLASLWWAVSEQFVSAKPSQQHTSPWVAAAVRPSLHYCMNVSTAPGAADGRYALALKAADTAGNSWHNSTVHVWSVDTVAPTSCTVSTPSAVVNSSRIPLNFGPFGGSQGIVGHRYALLATDTPLVWRSTNGARSVTVHVSTSVLAHSHTNMVIQVKAVDAAGNVGTWPCASLSVTIDTAPPVTAVHSPSQGAALRTPYPRIALHHSESVVRVRWWWQEGGDARGVKYSVPSMPFSNATSITIAGDISSDGPKAIWIQAEDAAGNLEATPVSFSWVRDTVAPSVGLARNLILSQHVASTRLNLEVAVRDNLKLLLEQQGGAAVWYSTTHMLAAGHAAIPPPLLWTPITPLPSVPPATTYSSLPITVAVLDDGWYALALKAVDAAGNTAINRSALQWAVDTTPPTAEIAIAPLNTSLGRSTTDEEARFSFRCTSLTACKPWGGHQPCAPSSDCASYLYRVVAAAVSMDSGCSAATEVVPWTTSPSRQISMRSALLRPGRLRLEVKAVDAVGLLQLRSSSHMWVVFPSQEVVVSVLVRPPVLSAWDTAPFTFQATMGGAALSGQRFQLRVDTETGPWQTPSICLVNQSTCSHVLRGLARGPHVVHARAVDPGSGIPSASVSVQWTLGVCNTTAYALVSDRDGSLRCVLCPAGANCTADDVTLPSMGAQIGWWAAAGRIPPVQFYPCPLPGSCKGGGNTTVASACTVTFKSSSVLCGTCAAGHVRQKEACTVCPEVGLGVTLVVLCTLLLVAFICFSVSPSNSGASTFRGGRENHSVVQRILISFLSTLTTIGDFRARGPQLVQDFIGLTSTVSGGVSIRFAPIRCTLALGSFAELLVTLGMPMFLLCGCAAVVVVRSRLNRRFHAAQQAMVGCAVFTALLVYPTLTRATLQVFRCTGVVDGSRYLLHDLSVQCFRGTHSVAVLVSALATAVVGLGVPATIITRVATSKTRGARLRLKRTYEFIFDGYLADRLLWWEALVLLRKFTLQCVEVFIADATIQASVASWIIVAAVAVHLWWRPYNSVLLNRLDALSLSVSYVTQALSSAYPVLLSTGGDSAGFVEPVVTVVLLGLNIGTILAMAALALRVSPVFQRRRNRAAPPLHPAAATTLHMAAAATSSSSEVGLETRVTAVVLPAPTGASPLAGSAATAALPSPLLAASPPAISNLPPRGGTPRRKHGRASSHHRHGRRRQTRQRRKLQ